MVGTEGKRLKVETQGSFKQRTKLLPGVYGRVENSVCLAGFAAFLNIWSSHSGRSQTREYVETPPLSELTTSASQMAMAVVSAGTARRAPGRSGALALAAEGRDAGAWLRITWLSSESGPAPLRLWGGACSLQTPSMPTLPTPNSHPRHNPQQPNRSFSVMERTVRWELAKGGNIAVCCL